MTLGVFDYLEQGCYSEIGHTSKGRGDAARAPKRKNQPMRIYFVQEKDAGKWKPAAHRYLMPTFTSKRAAEKRIRRYAKTREQRGMYRVIGMNA